ncbi:hypothetical protein [Nitrosovibrio sp. Nv6]|uniref:hypothetical protein n=1 Tax=Nitrosovibrio sp. Nv6 TaxID=1855340 RepID=UPI0008C9E1C0|nr:hypothetical protein [Nitrosovibrio sp. Nv6]SEO79236.1 hypothetical protein SAMN05216316_1114 [Nitrosovibrio sp. Nv6]
MPVMNFDLEDGLPPVSFSLKEADCVRFMAFMAECDKAFKDQIAVDPAPPAPEVEPVGIVRSDKLNDFMEGCSDYLILFPSKFRTGHETVRLYAHPDNDGLRKAAEKAMFALEPYDDLKPRDWVTDREKLRIAYTMLRAELNKDKS